MGLGLKGVSANHGHLIDGDNQVWRWTAGFGKTDLFLKTWLKLPLVKVACSQFAAMAVCGRARRVEEPDTKMGRYKAPDSLLRFLQTL